MAANEATLYEVKQGAAWITLNRPDNRNALSRVLVNELFDHLGAAQEDKQARAVVITGAGPAFCSGADLKNPPGQAADGRRAMPYQELLQAVLDSSKPVIAAVNGAAFAGGLGLLGAADIVLIAEEAQCSFAEVRIGVIPAIISVVCLPKLGSATAGGCSSPGRGSAARRRCVSASPIGPCRRRSWPPPCRRKST